MMPGWMKTVYIKSLKHKTMLHKICIMPTNSPGLDLWVYDKYNIGGVYQETIQQYLNRLRKYNEEYT